MKNVKVYCPQQSLGLQRVNPSYSGAKNYQLRWPRMEHADPFWLLQRNENRCWINDNTTPALAKKKVKWKTFIVFINWFLIYNSLSGRF